MTTNGSTSKLKAWVGGGVLTLAGLTLVSLTAGAQSRTGLYFKRNVNIPFALKSGSKVVKPGEYLLTIRSEGGQPLLTLERKPGDVVLRQRGESQRVPEANQDFKQGGRLRIFREAGTEAGESAEIVFLWDYVNPLGRYVRLRIEVPEAH